MDDGLSFYNVLEGREVGLHPLRSPGRHGNRGHASVLQRVVNAAVLKADTWLRCEQEVIIVLI